MNHIGKKYQDVQSDYLPAWKLKITFHVFYVFFTFSTLSRFL